MLSKALYSIGSTSARTSSRGVFSRMTCRFSNKMTVAWIDFGNEKTFLEHSDDTVMAYYTAG